MKKLLVLLATAAFLIVGSTTLAMAGSWLVVEKAGNVRSGPGVEYSIVGSVNRYDIMVVVGTNYHNKDGFVVWFPIEEEPTADQPKELIVGWFQPCPFVNYPDEIGDQLDFFEEGTEDGLVGFLFEILPGTRNFRYGVYRKGRFSPVSVKMRPTKWVHTSLVKEVGGIEEADSYVNFHKARARREARINNLDVPEALKAVIKDGKITLGMTKEQVTLAWRSPDDLNSSVGSYGRHEQWIYRWSNSKTDYLYFENGVLTSYQLDGR